MPWWWTYCEFLWKNAQSHILGTPRRTKYKIKGRAEEVAMQAKWNLTLYLCDSKEFISMRKYKHVEINKEHHMWHLLLLYTEKADNHLTLVWCSFFCNTAGVVGLVDPLYFWVFNSTQSNYFMLKYSKDIYFTLLQMFTSSQKQYKQQIWLIFAL